VQFASLPDREFLVGELWAENDPFAEIDAETGKLRITIFSQRDKTSWTIDLDGLDAALGEIRTRIQS
jgi:hypothetical protein